MKGIFAFLFLFSTLVWAQAVPREEPILGTRKVEGKIFATFPDHTLHNCIYICPQCTPDKQIGFAIAYSEEINMYAFYCGQYEAGEKVKLIVEEGI